MKNKQKNVGFFILSILLGIFLLGNFAEAGECQDLGGKCELYDIQYSSSDPCGKLGMRQEGQKNCNHDEVCCLPLSYCCEKICKPPEGGKCLDGSPPIEKACSQVESCKSSPTPTPTPAPASSSDATGGYVPMEEIPGFGRPGDWPSYILAVYEFGIWTIGISAMLMIMIGGYMYLMSAGNAASSGKAKGIITDAIAGLIIALTAWLILHTINPELVNLPKNLPASLSLGSGGSNPMSSGGSGGAPSSKCVPVTSGPCSVENLKNTCFGANAEKASSICKVESGGRETIPSGVDKCQPGGQPASYGLFQINISANNVADVQCAKTALTPTYTSKNHNCTPQVNFDKCVSAAKTASKNIEQACRMSNNGQNWGAWGANKECHFQK